MSAVTVDTRANALNHDSGGYTEREAPEGCRRVSGRGEIDPALHPSDGEDPSEVDDN